MSVEATPKLIPLSSALVGVLTFVFMGSVQALYGPSLSGFSGQFRVPISTTGLILSAHGLGALTGVLCTLPLAGHALARYRTGIAVVLLAVGALILGWTTVWAVALLGAVMIGLLLSA